VLSINPIDMPGRVRSEAEGFELPYEVLVGRDSDIIEKYQIFKLPRILVIAPGGTISYTERYATYDRLKEEVNKARAQKPHRSK
jgi:hypothetical protein